MSNSKDTHVTQVKFDGKQFAKGVEETNSLLTKLKENLNLKKSTQSFNELGKAASRFSMRGIAEGVDVVSRRFSTMGIIGTTALANITNSAVNAGKRMIKSLTIDPVKTGFDEYETKMNSIKTILSNTEASGTTLGDVNKALAELNDYSDQTVYNFAQMTDMVSKFAAKSGELDSSVSIVKGMANLAAKSGVGNTELQTALFQMSQISETVQLLDWRSIENANLATVAFRDDLIKMAKDMGAFDKIPGVLKSIEDGSLSFRDSLSEKWLSKNILDAVTDMYANDDEMTALAGEVTTFTKLMTVMSETVQSGWATTWEAIVGDKQQSAQFFGKIRDGFASLIKPSVDARNAMWTFWNAPVTGGREAVIEGLKYAFEGLLSILKPIKEAFHDIFPPMTGQRLVDLSKKFRDIMKNFGIGKDNAELLRRSFKGLFALLDIGRIIVKSAIKVLLGIGEAFDASSILEFTAGLGDFIVKISDSMDNSEILGTIIGGLTKAFGGAYKFLSEKVIPTVIEFAKKIDLWGNLKKAGMYVAGFGLAIWEGLKGLRDNKYVLMVQDAFKAMWDGVTNALANAKVGEKLQGVGLAIAGFFKAVWDGFKNLGDINLSMDAFFDKFRDAEGNLSYSMQFIKDMFDDAKGAISGFSKVIKDLVGQPSWAEVKDFLKSGLFAGLAALVGVKLYKLINGTGSVMEGLAKALEGLKPVLKAYAKDLKANALLKTAGAIAVLVASIIALAFVPKDNLIQGTLAMLALLTGLTLAVAIMSKLAKSASVFELGGLAAVLVGLSVAVLAMIGAIALIGKMMDDPAKLAKSIGYLGWILLTMVAAVGVLSYVTKGGDLFKKSLGLFALVAALALLVKVVKKLGAMEWDEIKKGLIATGVLFGALTLLLKFGQMDKMGMSAGIGILAIAAGMLFLMKAVEGFGNMDTKVLAQGIAVIIGALVVMGIMLQGLNNTKIKGAASTVFALAGSMLIFAVAFKLFGLLEWEEIGKGVAAVAGLLLAVGLSLKVMGDRAIQGASKTIVAMAVAMVIMAGAFKAVENIKFGTLMGSVLAFSVVMLAMAAAIRIASSGGGASGGMAAIGMAASMLIMAAALKRFEEISWDTVKKGMYSLLALIGTLAVIALLGNAGKTVMKGVVVMILGTLALAAALKIIALALKDFEEISFGTVIKGFGALLALFGVMALAVVGASMIGPMLLGLVGMLAGVMGLAVTLAILAAALQMFDNVSWESLGKGLLALAGMFIILGISAIVLGPLLPILFGLSVVLILIGMTTALAGLGVMVLAAGFQAMAKLGKEGAESAAEALITIAKAVPEIARSFAEGVVAFVETLLTHIPTFIEAGTQIILALLDTLELVIPRGVEVFFNLVQAILTELDANIPTIIEKAISIMVGFIEGLANGLETNRERIVLSIRKLFKELINIALGIITGSGIDFIGKGSEIVSKFIEGIKEKFTAVKTAIALLLGKAKDKIKENVEDFIQKGKDLIGGLIEGIKKKADDVKDAVIGLASDIKDWFSSKLKIFSPSRVFKEQGGYIMEGLIVGIDDMIPDLKSTTEGVGDTALNSLKDTLGGLGGVLDGDFNFDPTITPVLDLSNIESGMGDLNSMLDTSTIIPAEFSSQLAGNTDLVTNQNGISSLLKSLLPEIINNSSMADVIPNFEFNVQGNLDQVTAEDIVGKVTTEIRNALKLRGAF